MLSKENISINQVNSVIPKGRNWIRSGYEDFRYLDEEERLFNNVFIKVIEGQRHRCTKLSFTKEHLRDDVGSLLNENTVLVNSFLRRVISPRAPFFNYKNGRAAVTALTQQFRNELNTTLTKNAPGYRLLKDGEAYQISCYFVATGPDSSTFEGSTSMELRWYAESIRDGKEHLRPLVFSYCSKLKV